MQKEQENFYLNEDFESLENELEILSKEQVLRIEINEGLEIALQDLQNLKDKIPQEQTQGLFEQCTKSAMDAVTGHFGFAAVVLGSQDGGNVNTTHNARAGIYASDKERNAYENREKYDSRLYHGETSYKK